MPSSRESSQPRDQTQVSHIAAGFFTIWAIKKTKTAQLGLGISSAVFAEGLKVGEDSW